ncbi:MAG: bifunctional DNA-formamidopyrimidine glycosylase/DNA-(apurinic or apyrimidinic site) lyase [Alphaproteobacteria bacterium]|nr:bifunctional DNA-formamidopyrimidine glycosylase/DNA-(apurinic or apyrimidinic site) lyase [Alphaproteobacteria bacterium]NCQ88723.1 bifunctional DNA-formamidopyrimidine glycosylase/DNA-(apurinic or apyrimidinic site) lyase [Alphaproteobacteria bacterium]NCT08179.1 bifunctional DNA-formamidopyrimidine glycosylase/DNA-(apurinic or apyrimidinic site) lyase [Alphaproteobacteria bacterium]
MPELPEVETVMRGLEPAMVGQKIAFVNKRRPDLRVPFPKNIKSVLEGARVLNMTRRAKYILIHTDQSHVLVIHLGMSGRILIETNRDYKPQKHDHIILTMADKTQIIYNDPRRFGMIFFVKNGEFEIHKAFKDMGPEPLGNDFNAPVLQARLKGKTTSIKQALLDQRVVVGLGNIYACEALYEAGISPQAAAGSISLARLEVLTQKIKNVLKRAIDAGGSSLRDYRQASGELGYFQHSFLVYDREGQVCKICASKKPIQRIVQSGRSTFFCSTCQKR